MQDFVLKMAKFFREIAPHPIGGRTLHFFSARPVHGALRAPGFASAIWHTTPQSVCYNPNVIWIRIKACVGLCMKIAEG